MAEETREAAILREDNRAVDVALANEQRHEADLRTLKRRLLAEADKRRDQAARANAAEAALKRMEARAGRLELAEDILHQAETVATNGGDPTNILRSYAYFGESSR